MPHILRASNMRLMHIDTDLIFLFLLSMSRPKHHRWSGFKRAMCIYWQPSVEWAQHFPPRLNLGIPTPPPSRRRLSPTSECLPASSALRPCPKRRHASRRLSLPLLRDLSRMKRPVNVPLGFVWCSDLSALLLTYNNHGCAICSSA